ncbi:short-chain dehydrogenase [Micromonospora rosaria]|uniref:Short-chain dehydrogenase n=1 Tax=Micromonospora rosaria TaxID=47874 RepID=A0A136PZU7_9ACTN|nr:SDR family oxidoreductase [Micromonospora rosaria]KXK63962.1 short-chain dehydrogenase [Micromonospora rosaria]
MARLSIVSGGGTGIGRAVAERLAQEGSTVAILGRRAAVLERAASEINETVGDDRVVPYPVDLTVADEVAAVASRLRERGDAVDVLVANAGGNAGRRHTGPGLDAEVAAWRADFETNVVTSVLLVEAFRADLRRPGGAVVLLGSVAAYRPTGSYGAAKAAVHAWTYTLATQLADDGITVNTVAPGFIPDTEFFGDQITPEFRRSRVDATPLGRPGTPEEVAAAVGYLASPQARFTTGQIIQVNGGMVYGRG